MTASGDLVVDDIVASCYSEVEAVQLQSIVFGYVQSVQSAAKLLLTDNLFSSIFGFDGSINPIGGLLAQLVELSQKLIA